MSSLAKPAGIAAKRCAEVARLTHRLWSGMQARERPRGGATRGANVVNREGQRVVRGSASLTSERARAGFRGSGEQPASWRPVKYPVGERQAACCISWPKRRAKRLGRARRNGALCRLAQWQSFVSKTMVAGSNPVLATNAKGKDVSRRVSKSGLMPKPPGNSAVRKPQADGPWQNTARSGGPCSEPARLTVSELPTRYAARVNRHTPKKAVMVAYVGAGFGWAAVDRRATVARQRGRYSRQRVAVNDVVSVVLFFGPVAQQAEHATDNREGDRSNRSRSTTLWE